MVGMEWSQLTSHIHACIRRHLADLTTDMADRKNADSGDTQKYEVLYKRDQEMTEFIEKFEETKASIM